MATAAPAAALTTAIEISPGGQSTCAVMTGGNAYCWGDNTYGQLGNGTTASSGTPVLVAGGHTWASISTSADVVAPWNVSTTCGVTTTHDAYCWGQNKWGEVGNGTTTQQTTPSLVSGSHVWSSITVGYLDVCGVTTTNEGYCWGYGGGGELGDGAVGGSDTPALVSGAIAWASISIGSKNACGVTTGGAGYCWGQNGQGEIGNGTTNSSDVPTAIAGGYTWSSLAAGSGDACGITTNGTAYCWGMNNAGEDGTGNAIENDSPTAVLGGYTWSHISVGLGSTCALTTSGTAYCWGANGSGEVGDGTHSWRNQPALVLGGYTFASISNGGDENDDTNCGLAPDGIAYCWGANGDGQIGNGTIADSSQPTESSLLYATVDNTDLSVTITPTFTFSVANQPLACNGESNFVSGAGTANAVMLGNLAAGANVSGGQAFTVAGNSGGGFAVYLAGSLATNNLHSASHNWTDVTGTYALPAALGAGEQFGYTYKDSTAASSVTNPASANFIALTNTNEPVMGSASSTGGSGCVSFDAQTSSSTPAATYSAIVVYTAVPAF